MNLVDRFARLGTAAKLLLILTAVLLPIGAALALIGEFGIRHANAALDERNEVQSRTGARAIESLIARNALALRIATNGALAEGPQGACDRARRSLAIAPAISQSFEIESSDGKPICAAGEIGDSGALPLVAPGDIRVQIGPTGDTIAIRVGVIDGMATAAVAMAEIRTAAIEAGGNIAALNLNDGAREIRIIGTQSNNDARLRFSDWPLSNGSLIARVGLERQLVTSRERLLLLLPLLMWVAAALLTWLLVTRLLIRPLRRLERAVLAYQPGEPSLELPHKLGPSTEIRELRAAFARVINEVEASQRETSGALDGQRRLVREVHHRVKNNLQVVASLLNIHGRSADTPEARDAYAAIGRRVGALSIVHRNHFAEMEESRGIALRPLVTELAAELRANAPDVARRLSIDLDLDGVYTTQDVAVAVAFLITEIIEHSMLNAPEASIELSIRRTSELTARLSVGSSVLVPEHDGDADKLQFERIVGGLAKQLRSPLDRKLGRYSVDLPVFPAA
jgi:two-component sensor histidine kinase